MDLSQIQSKDRFLIDNHNKVRAKRLSIQTVFFIV